MKNCEEDPYLAKKIDFLITYEHKAREVEAISLLKNELQHRGYKVGLSTTYHERRMNFSDRRDAKVVITPALYNDDSLFAFVYWIAGACRKVVNLQWEQALTNQDESDPNFFQNPKGSARQATHICWGEASQARLMRSGVEKKNAPIIGPLHMDMLRPEARKIYQGRAELAKKIGLDETKEWILFVSSFTFTNMSSEEFRTEVKSLGDWLIDFVRISIESQNNILEWLELSCVRYPEKIFIYRPHQAETLIPKLEELKKKYSNFHVIHDFSVRQWIISADLIYTWYSTSAAEAFYLGKNSIILRPVQIPIEYDVSILRDAKFVQTSSQFLETLTKEKMNFGLNPALLERYFLIDNKRPAFKRACDLLEEVLLTNKYDMPPIGITRATYYYLQRLRLRLFFIAKELISRNYVFGLLKQISWIREKIHLHESLMLRMRSNRPRSFATLDELNYLNKKIDKIRKLWP